MTPSHRVLTRLDLCAYLSLVSSCVPRFACMSQFWPLEPVLEEAKRGLPHEYHELGGSKTDPVVKSLGKYSMSMKFLNVILGPPPPVSPISKTTGVPGNEAFDVEFCLWTTLLELNHWTLSTN